MRFEKKVNKLIKESGLAEIVKDIEELKDTPKVRKMALDFGDVFEKHNATMHEALTALKIAMDTVLSIIMEKDKKKKDK